MSISGKTGVIGLVRRVSDETEMGSSVHLVKDELASRYLTTLAFRLLAVVASLLKSQLVTASSAGVYWWKSSGGERRTREAS